MSIFIKLQNHFDWNGRVDRSGFFFIVLGLVLFIFFSEFIIHALFFNLFDFISTQFLIPTGFVYSLFLIVLRLFQLLLFTNILIQIIRRLHDLNFSGWYLLLFIFSFFSVFSIFFLSIPLLFFIILLFFRGNRGKNNYGEDPLNIT